MKKAEYVKEGEEIIRIKDDKVVAEIIDGKVVPKAPVYYKIIDELEAAASLGDEEAEEVVEKPSKKVAKPLNYDKVKELSTILHTIYAASKDKDADEMWMVLSSTAIKFMAPNNEEREPVELPSGGPEMSPSLGNRTPGYPTWLHSVNPEEAKLRFSDGRCAEYNELAK